MTQSSNDFTWEVSHELDVYNSPLDHRAISDLLGLQATRAWNKGEPHDRVNKPPYTFSRWIYSTRTWQGDTAAFNSGNHTEPLRELLVHLHARRSGLETVLSGATLTLLTVIHSDSFNIGYGLPPDCARLLADLNMRWYVDAYLAPKPDDELQ